jgi:ABC-type sugar transport system permease subunit
MKVRSILASPWAYGGWLVFLVAAFLVTYRIDPYVYAFTVLGLAWVSGLVVAVGIVASVLGKRSGHPGRAAWIGASALAIAATVIAALQILKGFRWA